MPAECVVVMRVLRRCESARSHFFLSQCICEIELHNTVVSEVAVAVLVGSLECAAVFRELSQCGWTRPCFF